MLITYNHEKYIAQALESILMQETDFEFEINVIEDCSTDRTQAIVMQYVRKYPHIVKPYFNEKNIGFKVTQENAYRGLRTCKGEYLAVLEGDDFWTSPTKLQTQVEFLDANPDFAICAHNTIKMYEDGTQDPHRFLYWGQRGDATVHDVIGLQSFFHMAGVLFRNVYKGEPPPQYRSKWSCDIFVMISHATFGKVHHIDKDWAVYRAHAGGRFSSMSRMKGWLYNIDGLRRYNAWLRYRYMKSFAESISRYCEHVLTSRGKEGVEPLTAYQFAKILALWTFYRSIYNVLMLPKRFKRVIVLPRTRLSKLPTLHGAVHWDLVWGLNVRIIPHQAIVPDHPVLQLTAIRTKDRQEQKRHALSECVRDLAPGEAYRISLWVKSVDGTHAQIHLRDSVCPETGTPAHEGEVRFDLTSSTVTMTNGPLSPAIEASEDGWQKISAEITTQDGRIFVYLGLLRKENNSHAFEGEGQQLLFGGIEITPKASSLT